MPQQVTQHPQPLTSHVPPLPSSAGMAAYGCIRAINTLLSGVSSLPELFPMLEELLFPIMHKMISTEGQDSFEEVGGEGQMWRGATGGARYY